MNKRREKTYRVSECGELLAHAVLFIIQKDLLEEFKEYLDKVKK